MIPGNFPPIGTVLATRSGGFSSFMIRMGAALRNKPNLSNHIAVMHHVDQAGVPWAIEGKPGGVGWVDARNYLKSKWTITNESQNLPTAARPRIAADMEAMLGRAYDWPAIFTAGNASGVEWYVVEQDECRRDPFDCLASSYRYSAAKLVSF